MTQASNPPLPDHPIDGAGDSPITDNALQLSAIGLATRFGPDWPGKRCLAKRHRHLVLVLRGDRAPGGNRAGNLGGNCTGPVTTPGCAIGARFLGLIGISGRW